MADQLSSMIELKNIIVKFGDFEACTISTWT